MDTDPRKGLAPTACRSKADLFAELQGDESDALWKIDETEAGRWMCQQCPIFNDCLFFSVLNHVDGFAAGLTPSERETVREWADIQLPKPEEGYSLNPLEVARTYLKHPTYSLDQMADYLQVDRSTVRRKRKTLKDEGILEWDSETETTRIDASKLSLQADLTARQEQAVLEGYNRITNAALDLDDETA
jgi:hypothetical protein